MTDHPEPAPTRADRRRATRARILDSARALFAERGFERTTVRAVAAAAGVDPALVMQHFGTKRELFAEAVQATTPPPAGSDPDALVDQLLTSLDIKLGGLPDGTLASLRSMLTDPDAADHARRALGGQIDSLAAALPSADDAELRAALVVTAMVGITIGHQLLALPALQDAPADRIAAILRPAFKCLTQEAT
ncbi:TetR/AcrR family transcriptional regulator [Streptomyces justiciae]|uniref:TetR/AcrR family transcriptional regulator n=1 Tax=Streptomyces justiciae TaxID=2780140 RepID=UPI00187FFDAE|nr:TetR/AcrR family transcriptional regulator [Streptomyces justiciae]MBE8469588.1 TetR family transcriptional regulator [Streptomyces justiciae]MCW8384322.1 TetR family transcriptional regulator [Streptomyces justiciae]